MKLCLLPRKLRPESATGVVALLGVLLAGTASPGLFPVPALGQQPDSAPTPVRAPVLVQPGAPGEPSRTLPLSTRPSLPQLAEMDVEFMQGMIMHHAQAVEMTALIGSFHPAACQAGMSPSQLQARYDAWVQLGQARAHEDQVCWNGGNENHQKEEANAWDQVANCSSLLQ